MVWTTFLLSLGQHYVSHDDHFSNERCVDVSSVVVWCKHHFPRDAKVKLQCQPTLLEIRIHSGKCRGGLSNQQFRTLKFLFWRFISFTKSVCALHCSLSSFCASLMHINIVNIHDNNDNNTYSRQYQWIKSF